MTRRICTAGVDGSISYLILDMDRSQVISVIKSGDTQIKQSHLDYDQASRWTEKKLRMLNGRDYETD